MHGRVQGDGESYRSVQRSSSQHMRSLQQLDTVDNTVAVAGDHSSITITATSDSFLKDGRKISIGDCALFKPPHCSPPFIGLIRWFTLNEENNLQLGVNWLYRPAELKLEKGILSDTAPNEIFYSFHKDKIPAVSLLHPCKVAFLSRGVELPTGASSFVCRRVYDIANKCLWWLTDQDYCNELQEEVDNLLYETRTEMHATFQPGGHSPKQVNGLTSTAQLKPGSDSAQNSGSYFPYPVKGKKRERGDQGADPVKQERSSRTDDGDSAQCKTESSLKSEIARIAEKGVVDLEGIEKLVQLMQTDRMERKMDLISRSMLAGVLAAIDKVNCLHQFVQLRGLPVLDEWLQDIHKGKTGDGYSSKDGDKFVEEFLLVLLRALDKLPVNLHALQMCNIGRSVNHLRSHKNTEIQRKARSLVDTWKKRVEAEMISIDAKSVSTQTVSVWPSKSRLPEASLGGSRIQSGSDVAVKSLTVQHSASKTVSAKSLHGESNTKSASSSPGSVKPASSPASGKESQPKISVVGTPDATLIWVDRSSSSNQSQNYSQSFFGKEDGKSSTAGSMTVNKISSISTRNRKISGFSGISVNGGQKETNSSRSSSAHKGTALEKLSQSSLTSERVFEGPIIDGSSHKLIVKIPNRVRSPAQGISGGSLEDPSFISSRASSPVLSDKHEQFERTSKDKNDMSRCDVASDVNVESWQTNDSKEVLTGSVEGTVLSAAPPDEEQSMIREESRRLTEGPKKNELNPGKLHAVSFSPMNALIESCVKYSEANSALPLEDDVGMNLLASVATAEMSRSDLVSPTDSTERSTPAVEEVCIGDEAKSKSSLEDCIAGDRSQYSNDVKCDVKKHAVLDGSSWSDGGLSFSKHVPLEVSADRKCAPSHISADTPAEEVNKLYDSSSTDLRSNADSKLEIIAKSNEKTGTTYLTLPISTEKVRDGKINEEIHKEMAPSTTISADGVSDYRSDGTNVAVTEEKVDNDVLGQDKDNVMVEVASSDQLCEGDCKKGIKEGMNVESNLHQKLTAAVIKSKFAERVGNGKLLQTTCGQKLMSEACDDMKVEPDEKDVKSCLSKSERQKFDKEMDRNLAVVCFSLAGLSSTANDLKSDYKEAIVNNKEIPEQISLPERGFLAPVSHEAQKNAELRECQHVDTEAEKAEGAPTIAEASSSSGAVASDVDAKVRFDLNECFTSDDGKYGEPVNLMASGSRTDSLPFSVNYIASGHPTSITVASAAKGPFVPPEDLLRSKGVELGWKGSAATSAFRPAEPRKNLEMPLGSTNMSYPDASTSKNERIPLDIDLNVPDERLLEEMASIESSLAVDSITDIVSNCTALLNKSAGFVSARGYGSLDLDLNRVDEANDNGHYSTSSNCKGEGSVVPVKPLGGLPTGDVWRDFDLNNGPRVDDTSAGQFLINQQVKDGIPFQLPSTGLRMTSSGIGSFSSWFPPGSTYSTVAIPSVLPDRGDQPFPVFPPGAPQRTFGQTCVPPFAPDVYQGSVLSSSPAVPFPSNTFQFPVFPFGPTFPLPSATFSVGANSYVDSSSGARLFAPSVSSQFLGPVGSISSQFLRPYVVGLPDSSSNCGLENNRKWSRQGLDLNAGPGVMENEIREILPLSSGQHSVASSQALAEEQSRMYSVPGGIMKRKEPEGGWDNENFRYKQFSWQ